MIITAQWSRQSGKVRAIVPMAQSHFDFACLFWTCWSTACQGRSRYSGVNILALQYPDSGKLSTDIPDVDTGIDWLVYLARYSQQCQAQSHFVVRSRLDIVENTEIMVGPNQSFYCGTLRPDCRPFRTGIFSGALAAFTSSAPASNLAITKS